MLYLLLSLFSLLFYAPLICRTFTPLSGSTTSLLQVALGAGSILSSFPHSNIHYLCLLRLLFPNGDKLVFCVVLMTICYPILRIFALWSKVISLYWCKIKASGDFFIWPRDLSALKPWWPPILLMSCSPQTWVIFHAYKITPNETHIPNTVILNTQTKWGPW